MPLGLNGRRLVANPNDKKVTNTPGTRVRLQDRITLRPAEAADVLGVSERTLRKWMRNEGLPYFRLDRIVRIPQAELTQWLAERINTDQGIDNLVGEILDDL